MRHCVPFVCVVGVLAACLVFEGPSKTSPGFAQEATAGSTGRSRDTARVTLTGHRDGIYSVLFFQNGRFLASASRDGTIKVYDVETGAVQATLTGHSGQVLR